MARLPLLRSNHPQAPNCTPPLSPHYENGGMRHGLPLPGAPYLPANQAAARHQDTVVRRLPFTLPLGATFYTPTAISLCGSHLETLSASLASHRRSQIPSAVGCTTVTPITGVLPLASACRTPSCPLSTQLWPHHFTAYTPSGSLRSNLKPFAVTAAPSVNLPLQPRGAVSRRAWQEPSLSSPCPHLSFRPVLLHLLFGKF